MNRLHLTLACAATLVTGLARLDAQAVSGTISGLVTDPSSATVANAAVSVVNAGTGVTIRATTTETGYYSVPNLIPGIYSVKIDAAGFKQYVANQIELSVDSGV